MTTNDASTQLETLIDRHGLANVLDLLAIIAGEKSEHIATNWQDASLAKRWDKATMYLDLAAAKIRFLSL